MQIPITEHLNQLQNLNQSADLKSVFQFHTPGTKENILSGKKFFGKKSCF